MAAPPPPPPPPPGPGPIAKPNNSKLLDSIRQGTGLKKVPDELRNDRSEVKANVKQGGNASAMPLPAGMKGPPGSQKSIADVLKARAQGGPGATPQKRSDIPAPNQNVGPTSNTPKPPDQTSKPSMANAFPPPPPPIPQGANTKPFAPPPGIQNKPMAPPPIATCIVNRPLAPPPIVQGNVEKPLPPPLMQPVNMTKLPAPPPIQMNMSNIPPPPPPPIDSRPSLPPPVFYSMKPTANDVAQPPMVFPSTNRQIPNNATPMNGSARNTPPQFAPPPPPPPVSSMPTKPVPMVLPGKPSPIRPPQLNSDMSINKPPLPVRNNVQSQFDSRFTFLDESSFPDPSTVSKGSRGVV